ncbi:V-type ATPase subunit [Thiolapillus sp.]
MGNQVASYAYLNTRVSLMAKQLLHRKQRQALLQLPLSELGPLLTQAGVGALAQQLPKDPARLEQFLATVLVGESIKLMRCLNSSERNFIRHWMRRLELINLKFLLRTKFSGSQPIDPSRHLLDLAGLGSLELQTLINTDSIEEFLRQLQSSSYRSMARPARKAFEEHRSLFDVEAALDANYYSHLVQLASALEGRHKQQTESLLRTWLDQINLVSLLRFRFVYKLSPPHAYFLLAPGGHRLSLRTLQQLAQLASVKEVVEHLPAPLQQQLAETGDIEDIEHHMQQLVRTRANKILRKQRFNMAIAYAYLYLREQQIQLIHAVLKGHLLGLSTELIQFCGDPLAFPALARRELP